MISNGMDAIAKLLGGAIRAKIIRLFVLNENIVLESREVAQYVQSSHDSVRTQLASLQRIGLLKRKTVYREIPGARGNRRKKRRVLGWMLDTSFPHLLALADFLYDTMPKADQNLLRRLRKSGKLVLVIAAGVFVHDPDGRTDLLIVADKLRSKQLESVIKDLESDMGKELRYTALSTEDFAYRVNMHDRLIRDIMDFPHEVLLDRHAFTEHSRLEG